jgi:hypothetical protein
MVHAPNEVAFGGGGTDARQFRCIKTSVMCKALERLLIEPFLRRILGSAPIRAFVILAAVLAGVTAPSAARPHASAQAGIAWQVQGEWRANDSSEAIRGGDAVEAGSLLQPVGTAGAHAVAVLLPDSQRVFYECFTQEDCARGFRVPHLMRAPDPLAVEMLARVRAELARAGRAATDAPASLQKPMPRDEFVAALDPENRVEIGGLAARLPNGHYACDAKRIDSSDGEPLRIDVEKNSPRLPIFLPGAGIYEITIRDDRDNPRIDLLVAAETSDRAPELAKPFDKAKALLKAWNAIFYAWPVHELLREYLEALVFDVKPMETGEINTVADADGARTDSVAAEPQFSPQAGYFGGDTEVSLQCPTPGATIHYMLDGAQPTANSPEYHAPIVVKASGITIKAFASAPGKKDSPVVTGTFLIQH